VIRTDLLAQRFFPKHILADPIPISLAARECGATSIRGTFFGPPRIEP
jgi:hypothetical protein